MLMLTGQKMRVAESLFNEYKNNIPIFRSVLEGNYEGSVFVDRDDRPTWAVLTTPICFHFVAGALMGKDILDDILFNLVLNTQDEKQIIVFSPSDDWQPLLKSVFLPRKGFVVPRKMFLFNQNNYDKVADWQTKMPEDAEMKVAKELLPFCIHGGWVAKLLVNGVCVSTCRAFMVGGGFAEIDVETHLNFRGRGYGTLTAIALIQKLLARSITPCWSAWPFREASQTLAQKIGFAPQRDEPAWLWDALECS